MLASTYPPYCPQSFAASPRALFVPGSEDCLFLSVFAPGGATPAADCEAKLKLKAVASQLMSVAIAKDVFLEQVQELASRTVDGTPHCALLLLLRTDLR